MGFDPYRSRFDELGFSAAYAAPFVEIDYAVPDVVGYKMKSKIGRLKPIFAYGITGGSSIPIAKLGEKGALFFNMTMAINYTKGAIMNTDFKINDKISFKEDLEFYRWYVPLGLEYKSRAEARSDKELKTMYTVGAGVALIVNSASLLEAYGIDNISPYLKFEFGYHMGIAFKLRATYFIGEQVWDEFYGAGTDNPYREGLYNYKVSTSGDLVIGLIIMPFSYTWNDN